MKDWVLLTVAVSVFSSVFSLLLSEKEMKNTFRFLSGAVLVAVLLSPLINAADLTSDFDFNNIDYEYSEDFIKNDSDIVLSAVTQGYEKILNDQLRADFPDVICVSVNMVSKDDEFILEEVEVRTNSDYCDYESIRNKVYEITETECEVVFEDVF